MRVLNRIVMHHSATPAGSVGVFRQQHIQKRLSHDIGYHIVVCNGRGGEDGELQRGLADEVKGAGVKKNNTGSLHICWVGNFHSPEQGFTGKPTKAQMKAGGQQLFEWKMKYATYQLRLTDHKTDALPAHPTACPGDQFPTRLIQAWFKTCHQLGSFTLDAFLEKEGYWEDERPGEPVETFPVPVRVGHIGQPPLMELQGLIINGRTYVPLKDLAAVVGWTAPTPVVGSDGKRAVRQLI